MGSPLISTAELAERLGQPGLKVVDASWHLDGRDGRAEYEQRRIPGAVFFDLEAASDQDSPLPHMLPSARVFAAYAGALGLSDADAIVVYDAKGFFSGPRIWWMLRTMGARDVRVLDGGLPKWLAEGRAVESGPVATPKPATFQARLDPSAAVAVEEMRTTDAQRLDARPAARFRGEAAEPRAGLRAGHMPGALNLPFPGLIAEDGTLKRGAALEAAFRDAGVDLDRPMITTCGSGVTAAILSLGLAVLGRESRLYDGSWAEWGGRQDTPVETG